MGAIKRRGKGLRGREENSERARGCGRMGGREYGGRNQKASAVERAVIGSGDLVGAWRRRGHHRGHGAMVSAVTAAAGRELRILGAGEKRRQGPKCKERDDQDG